MLDMVWKDILPAVSAYERTLAETAAAKQAAVPGASCRFEAALVERMAVLSSELYDRVGVLEAALLSAKDCADSEALAVHYRDKVFAAMRELRVCADELETMTAAKYGPVPTDGELLFGVQ